MNTNDTEMEAIIKALESAPDVAVPDDFAARLMARVPQQQTQRRYVLMQTPQAESHVGRTLAFAALLVLVVGMLLLAPHTPGSETWLLLQGLLFAQLVALLLWMGISYKRLL
jgi:hypothetical protein